MKRIIVFAILSTLTLAEIAAEAGAESRNTSQAEPEASGGQDGALAPGIYLNPVNRLRAYTLDRITEDRVNDDVEWVASFEGTVLGLMDGVEFAGETRRAVNQDAGTESVQEFARVRVPSIENREVWMSLHYLVPEGQPAAVKTLTPEYVLPLQQSPGFRAFNRGTVVLIHGASEADAEFVRVTGWDEEQGFAIIGALVPRENLTVVPEDVAAAVRIKSLRYNTSIRDEQKLELLKLPLAGGGDPADSEFSNEFQAFRESLEPDPLMSDGDENQFPYHEETVFFRTEGRIIDPIVNVRTFPSTKASLVGQLAQGDPVRMDAQTYLRYEVNGHVDYWYRIVSPVQGWVFGSLIEQ